MISEQLAINREQIKENRVYKNAHCYLIVRILLVSLLLALCSLLSFGQENVQIEIQTRFIQRLSWTPNDYALRYEVEIDREEDGIYSRYLTERTENSFIHISLPYGNYRFRVIPFDLLNRPGIITEYQYIEIKPAVQQEKENVLLDFYLGVSYFTHINIHGKHDYMNDSGQFLSGTALRLGLLTSNFDFFNIGVELVPAWYSVNSFFNEDKAKSFLLEGNILLHKDLFYSNDRPFVSFLLRTGAGLSYSFNENPVLQDNETSFYANIGFSFILMFSNNIYAEAGANYSYFFAVEYPTGRIRPFIGAGVRLQVAGRSEK